MASYFCSYNYNRLLSVTYESLFFRQYLKKAVYCQLRMHINYLPNGFRELR